MSIHKEEQTLFLEESNAYSNVKGMALLFSITKLDGICYKL